MNLDFRNIFIIFSMFVLVAAVSSDAFAQEEAVNSDMIENSAIENTEASLLAKEANTKLITLFNTLDLQQNMHYFQMYNSYNLVETIKIVQDDVANAINGCGANNPDMKAALDKRYVEWDGAINPVMEEAEGHFDNMLLVQDYADPEELDKIFSLLEQTRQYTREHINKIPVTTKDACEYLLGKMDETQANLIGLLRSTLVSAPYFGPENQQEENQQEEPVSEQDADSGAN